MRGDQQRGDRVGTLEAGREDHDRRCGCGGEAEQVGEDVLVGALDVEATTCLVVRMPMAVAAEDARDHEVDRDTNERDHQHRRAFHIQGRDQVPNRAVDDHERQHQERHPVGLRAQDLGTAEPEGHRAPGGARRESGRHQRKRQRRCVGQHVRGVREQRQR